MWNSIKKFRDYLNRNNNKQNGMESGKTTFMILGFQYLLHTNTK